MGAVRMSLGDCEGCELLGCAGEAVEGAAAGALCAGSALAWLAADFGVTSVLGAGAAEAMGAATLGTGVATGPAAGFAPGAEAAPPPQAMSVARSPIPIAPVIGREGELLSGLEWIR